MDSRALVSMCDSAKYVLNYVIYKRDFAELAFGVLDNIRSFSTKACNSIIIRYITY